MLILFANVHVIKRRQLKFHGICQFQFLDTPPHTHTKIFQGGGYKKNVDFLCKCSFNKKKTVNISWNLPVSVLDPPTHTKNFSGEGV